MASSQRDFLRRRVRALLIVGSMLLPTFCVFGVLGYIASGWVQWLIMGLWVVVGVLLGLLITRLLRTFEALDTNGDS